ncbi:Pimeloyl-ACP methyl ester carboxylesterase [Sinomicrobium oceani]|uniref:Pimeloyl-ACP methyl ester carboxylesterase n=1 Tax=Sinomicrobium oceani TaxID=1150368 RepID=A0A1K1PHE9_9FLAO|nr:alpha/beta hydrolase [Sinomicrobium oceani]SFW47216.1 Pimeloyl-ACP methyl ester carboxylesterase [Sinomicrobium oceani]
MKRVIALTCTVIFLYGLSSRAQDEKYSEWYLQREDTEIFVKEFLSDKNKDTVIVVHGGFGANHDYMTDAVRGLENEFHFVFYDQRGALLSPAKQKDLTFQKNVADLYALIKAMDIRKVKLLCHSMGTLIGMELTRQHPGLVTNLVLTGTVLPRSDSIKSIFSERYEKQVSILLNRPEVVAMKRPYIEKGLDTLKSVDDIRNSPLSHKDLTTFWRINFAAVNIYHIKKHHLLKGGRAYYTPKASIMSETVNWNYDYRKVLNDHAITTIINGAYDFFDFGGEMLHTHLKSYPGIDLHIIPGAGHNSWVDNPPLFREYLRKALLRTAGSR